MAARTAYAVPRRRHRLKSPQRHATSVPPPRVLLVDDEPGFRLLTRMLLEEDGSAEVAGEAGDGPQAIREARQLRPDAVLLDLNMPGMGGLEALPKIKAASPASKVIVL